MYFTQKKKKLNILPGAGLGLITSAGLDCKEDFAQNFILNNKGSAVI